MALFAFIYLVAIWTTQGILDFNSVYAIKYTSNHVFKTNDMFVDLSDWGKM